MKSPKVAPSNDVDAALRAAKAAPSLTGNPLSLALGENLKRIRQERGLTQQNLAFAAEMDRTFVSLCERGATNPSLYSLGTLCWCLKITMADLFSGIEHTLPPSGMTDGKKRRTNQASHEPRPPSASTLKRAETMRKKKLASQDAHVAATSTSRRKQSPS
ncbi:transcriptional regulator with XRE-family HTH domain [Variovorax boronicumulans]|uniref:helix-turn-helix domain-containing protein n=1 Tax=Variovorax boronicumulans TaxID=436515 RepID=UPI002781E0EF|nr:helix-turn-helix transcriptional regulator [Variovorax boronicumulans]MDP9996468.1 transcriptional regulator with XRE-family HTH domain [Variovorax boronicumulans]MDQ0007774.1 transcriptional regulator with XRE-family HTH domain [Variovorax boronicumulans]